MLERFSKTKKKKIIPDPDLNRLSHKKPHKTKPKMGEENIEKMNYSHVKVNHTVIFQCGA